MNKIVIEDYSFHVIADISGPYFEVSPQPGNNYARTVVRRATERVREWSLGKGTRIEFDVDVPNGQMTNIKAYTV